MKQNPLKATPPQIPSLKLQQAQVMQMSAVEDGGLSNPDILSKKQFHAARQQTAVPYSAVLHTHHHGQEKVFLRTPKNQWYANSQTAGSLRGMAITTTPTALHKMNSEIEKSPAFKMKRLNTQIA